MRQWIKSESNDPYNSFGNGSAMRVSPCIVVANSIEECEALAAISAAVTHNHPEGIKGAMATASAGFMAYNTYNKQEIKEYVENKYGYNLDQTLDEIRPGYQFNETCQGTVPQAIIAFLESTDFEDAIRNAISIGGDSDTLAAITGTIAGGFYQIPEQISDVAFDYLDDRLFGDIINLNHCDF
jgi:ADP-ribosylglycohydrolase